MKDLHFMVTRGGIVSPLRAHTDPRSVAQALGKIVRFAGNGLFYTVLIHSLVVSDLVKLEEARLCALLHDASEIAVSDVPSPFKTDQFRTTERQIQLRILEALEVPAPSPKVLRAVHQADQEALHGEVWTVAPKELRKHVRKRNKRAERLVKQYMRRFPPSDNIRGGRIVTEFVKRYERLRAA